MHVPRATILIAIASLPAAPAARAQETVRASLRGVVVAAETGERVSYALIALDPGGERFADSTGAFVYTALAPGKYHVRLRQVGYAPFDTTLVIGTATPPMRFELKHIALEVAAVTVRTSSECASTDTTEARTASSQVFVQLSQNAERYRVLADRYPFSYLVTRRFEDLRGNGMAHVHTDTLRYDSNARHPYAPGDVVRPDPDVSTGNAKVVRLPTLPDFADAAFQRFHCFRLVGVETIEGHRMIRMDFVPSRRLQTPDVDGSAYLDTATFQVRYTRVRLTRVADAAEGVESWEALTKFADVVPSLFVVMLVRAETRLTPTSRDVVRRTEEQRLMQVLWLRARPGAHDSLP